MRSRFLKIVRAIAAFFKRHGAALGKAVLVVFIAALAALCAVVDNTVIGYLPLCMVVFGVVVNFAYLQILRRAVSVEEDFNLRDCNRGETVDIGVTVANRSFLLCPRIEASLFISNLTGEANATVDQCISLLPKESRRLEITARFDHIGRYRVGLQSLTIYDLFGLFTSKIAVSEAQEVEVAPYLVDISKLDVEKQAAAENAANNQTALNDGFDYVGMRDYALGDPMKSIHWKASARYEDLMTRLYEHQINPTICVVVDSTTQWPGGERMMCMYDAVIEAALSIASYAQDNGIECVVVVADGDGEPREFLPRKPWGYSDILDALPRLYGAKEGVSAAFAVRQAVRGMYTSNNIIVCSSNPDERLISEMISSRVVGKHMGMYFARPADLERAQEDSLMRSLSQLSAAQIPYRLYADARELRGI